MQRSVQILLGPCFPCDLAMKEVLIYGFTILTRGSPWLLELKGSWQVAHWLFHFGQEMEHITLAGSPELVI